MPFYSGGRSGKPGTQPAAAGFANAPDKEAGGEAGREHLDHEPDENGRLGDRVARRQLPLERFPQEEGRGLDRGQPAAGFTDAGSPLSRIARRATERSTRRTQVRRGGAGSYFASCGGHGTTTEARARSPQSRVGPARSAPRLGEPTTEFVTPCVRWRAGWRASAT